MPYCEILEAVNIFKNSFDLLYPDAKSMEIFVDLITRHQPDKNTVFDMEVVSIMLANGLRHIATFNEKDFKCIEKITIIT